MEHIEDITRCKHDVVIFERHYFALIRAGKDLGSERLDGCRRIRAGDLFIRQGYSLDYFCFDDGLAVLDKLLSMRCRGYDEETSNNK